MTKDMHGSIATDGFLMIGGNKSQTQTQQWQLPEETPIAIRINGETYAIMLATPLDLIDFARGFCLSEGLVKSANAIKSIRQKNIKEGKEVIVTLSDDAFDRFNIIDRRRRLAGASGCGVCGLTSLSHIVEKLPKVKSNNNVSLLAINKAKSNLRNHTPLNTACFSVHAAVFADKEGNILFCREDVGRHNALDKLIGTLSENEVDVTEGFILITSRFAYELVQKCARIGAPVIISISAPTSMAVKIAKQANMSFAAFANKQELMIFTGIERFV